jgi:CBS domain-containing protein
LILAREAPPRAIGSLDGLAVRESTTSPQDSHRFPTGRWDAPGGWEAVATLRFHLESNAPQQERRGREKTLSGRRSMRNERTTERRTLRDVMKRDVVTVVPEMTVRELMQTFVDEHVRGAPVVGPEGKIIGMVSETDVLRVLRAAPVALPLRTATAALQPGSVVEVVPLGAGRQSAAVEARAWASPGGSSRSVLSAEAGWGTDLDAVRVGDIMTPVGAVFTPGEPVARAVEAFSSGGLQRIVVIENGILLGIATPADLMRSPTV